MTRFGWVMTTYFSVVGIGATALFHPAPRLIWNASASVPIGLYAVHRPAKLHVGDIVIVRPPEPLARYLDARRSLPEGVPLVKPIAALVGQTICRIGRSVSVDGLTLAEAQEHDRHGRRLPVWQGCRVLAPGEVFLMNPAQPDSLDGRYFGPLPLSIVIGRAVPLWIPKEP